MGENLYYNFDTLSGNTGIGTENKIVAVTTNDQPVIRWGKSDYKADRVYISADSSSKYYLVVLCKSGGANIYLCIPLVSGSTSSSEIENLNTVLGTDSASAKLTLNNVLSEQQATVYNKNTIVLSKDVSISSGNYSTITKQKTGKNIELTGAPVKVDIYHQEMDWMIDCELVGEEGSQTVAVSKGISDLNSAAFAIVIITLAAAAIYMFVPNYMSTFFREIDTDGYAGLTRFIWVGSVFAMISITIWGFVAKKLLIASLLLFGIVAFITAGSFSAKNWALSPPKPKIKLEELDYSKSLFDLKMIVLYVVFLLFLIPFSGASAKVEVEYTYYAILSIYMLVVFVGSTFMKFQ